MARPRCALLLFACFAALPRVAAADDIATEEEICRYRKEGDACTIGDRPGKCRAATCSRIDYSSGKPQAAERPCQQCVPDDATPTPPGPTATPTTPAATDPKAAGATPAADSKTSAPPAPAPAKKGCAVDDAQAGPAALLLVLMLARRRSARRRCQPRPQR
ncbi:MAG: hypothetical protein K1X88_15600 [Nannocystaceae bacterium]|nr:hypothetical protein [Nannocystaceae bacterium]